MRYIADSSGYLKEVAFGCQLSCGGKDCTEYTGSVPAGYTSLEAWYMGESDKLYRWKIVSGNLTLDSSAVEPSGGASLIAEKNRYFVNGEAGLNLQNSDIYKANGIYFADPCNASSEGLIFPRDDGGWDTLRVYNGNLYITQNSTVTYGGNDWVTGTNCKSDYSVEQGASGIWSYRKWNSGLAECWGTYNASGKSTAAAGNTATITLPFTFADADFQVFMTPGHNGSVVSKYGDFNGSGSKQHTTKNFVINYQLTSAYAPSFNVEVKGKWK